MSRLRIGLLLLASILIGACNQASQPKNKVMVSAPDSVYINGQVLTLDKTQSKAEALAIKDGVIVALGKSADILQLASDSTDIVDLQGQALMPGLHDQHVHPVFAGIQANRCVIPQGASLAEFKIGLGKCVNEAEAGEWILGGQWDASALAVVPHRSMLDEVASNNPVLLGDTSAHSAWANSLALSIAGVSAATPNPENGIIERDANGDPTGLLHEDAVFLVRKFAPEATDREVEQALQWGVELMLSNGITSFTEASVGYSTNVEKELKAYASLADSGMLKQRVRLCLPWSPDNAMQERAILQREQYQRDRLSPDCIKIMLDGVPTESHTAAMLQPYHDAVIADLNHAHRYGLLAYDQQTLDSAVQRFDSMGMAVKFHSAGDAAVRAGLDAIAAARANNGLSAVRHDVGHCTFVAKADIPRAQSINATFEMSPYLWGPSPISNSIALAVGPEVVKRVWPVRDVIEAGSLAVAGSDWSVVPSVNPWVGIEMLVTRQKPGGSDESFGPDQAIRLDQALELFTINSAKHLGVENQLGRLLPGMLADMIVIDRNPYTAPVHELHKIRLSKTIINGEVVYEAGEA